MTFSKGNMTGMRIPLRLTASIAASIYFSAVLSEGVAQRAGPVQVAEVKADGLRTPPKMCWTPDELRGLPGDWEVRKGIPGALQHPPRRSPLRSAPVADNLRGVIRSVQVPDGIKVVALTFDLCEQPYEVSGYDSRIVDYLRAENVKATFFAGGKWLITHELRAQQILADPLFEIGNHTWEHRNLRIVTREVLQSEIESAQAAYEQVREDFDKLACSMPSEAPSGVVERKIPPQTTTLFRFPFGACNSRSLKAVNDAGLLAIQWDIASGDPASLQTADKIVSVVMSRVRPGSILLFHANGRGWHTREALGKIIPALKAEGYKFLTVTELLNFPDAKIKKVESCFDEKPNDSDHYDELARRLEERYRQFTERERARRHGDE